MPPSLWPCQAEIDLKAIWENARALRGVLAEGTGIIGVVKADGYGHGAVDTARALEAAGVDMVAVTLAAEVSEIRDAHVRTPILVLQSQYREWASFYQNYEATPSIHDIPAAQRMSDEATGTIGVHLGVDTGMSRLGVPWRDVQAFLEAFERIPKLRIDGVYSHFACAGDAKDGTNGELCDAQLARFREALEVVRGRGHEPQMAHMANSAATLRYPESHFDAVRVGLALYGVLPCEDLAGKVTLRPAMRLSSEVGLVKDVPEGTTVGYGAEFTTRRPTRLAIVPIGYADGIPVSASPGMSVVVRGKRVPVVGRVSMDLIAVDITDLADAGEIRMSEPVEIFGQSGPERIRVEDLARWAGTIPYEILTGIGHRVHRRPV